MHQHILNGNNNFLNLAVNEAWKYQLLTYPNPAVGACIVKNDKVLAVQAHKLSGMPHAEVNALKSAFLTKYPNSDIKNLTSSDDIHNYLIKNHNDFFSDCDIYVTLEPCSHIGKTPSCANLLKSIKIDKVIIGKLDTNKIASGGISLLKKSNINARFNNSQDCNNLLLSFSKWQMGNFTFFKMASRLDSSIDGGYITTQDSLNLVHDIRTKLDLLVIGGQTVRSDRPTLDSRFSKYDDKKSADILIYSKETNFDKSIPLFGVENRKVTISDKLDYQNKNFVMIEGGYNLLNQVKNNIDMLMLFVSHKNKTQNTIYQTICDKLPNMKLVHSYFINQYDEIRFYTKKG